MSKDARQSRPEAVVMPFGRHKGKTLSEIVAEDPTYIDWLMGQEGLRGPLLNAVKAMSEKYAPEIEAAIEWKRHA